MNRQEYLDGVEQKETKWHVSEAENLKFEVSSCHKAQSMAEKYKFEVSSLHKARCKKRTSSQVSADWRLFEDFKFSARENMLLDRIKTILRSIFRNFWLVPSRFVLSIFKFSILYKTGGKFLNSNIQNFNIHVGKTTWTARD